MTSTRTARGARPFAAALAASGVLAGAALLTVAPQAAADTGPSATPASLAAAHEAATDAATLDTLSRFFAREGAVTRAAAPCPPVSSPVNRGRPSPRSTTWPAPPSPPTARRRPCGRCPSRARTGAGRW